MAKIKPDILDDFDDLVADPGYLQVSVESFTVTPSTIKPFESSILQWKVISLGPTKPTIMINGEPVQYEGSMTVRPSGPTTYRLTTKQGPGPVQLSKVDINVDESECEEALLSQVETFLSGAFGNEFAQSSDIYLLGVYESVGFSRRRVGDLLPDVNIDETGVSLSFRVGANVDKFPDPTIKGDFKFRWAIIDDVIEPYFTKQDVSVDFPFYAWAVPGAVVGLPIASGFARDKTRRLVREGLIEFAALFLNPLVEGRMYKIRTTEDSRGSIFIKHCPDPTPPKIKASINKIK